MEPGVYKVCTSSPKFTTNSMGTHIQNKISMDVAADSSSLESLSFTGLVCIQDQQSKSPNDRAYQNNTDEEEFEFVSTTPGTDPHYLKKKDSHPNMIISDSRLLPLKSLLLSAQCQAANKPDYKRSQPSSLEAANKPDYKRSQPSSLDSSKMPLDNHANPTKVHHKTNQANNQVKKEQTASRSWSGHKIFQSFVSPCRECRAASPTIKANNAPQERIKSQ